MLFPQRVQNSEWEIDVGIGPWNVKTEIQAVYDTGLVVLERLGLLRALMEGIPEDRTLGKSKRLSVVRPSEEERPQRRN